VEVKFDGVKKTINGNVLSKRVIDWTKDDAKNDICWLTGKKFKVVARPSLKACYRYTYNSCCNFVEDEDIGN